MANGKTGGTGKYVTRGECQVAMLTVGTDITMIKKAMIGDDMQGGMVKNLAGLNAKVDRLIQEKQCAGEISLKWKLMIASAVASALIAAAGMIASAVVG